MLRPPIVYLDTQDYSRFGDVLRGKSDAATEGLFRALERRKEAGDVIFAVSMPILGELLQYDADYRETTLRKAEAVERLCGSWALAFPSRLIAIEVVQAAQRRGLIEESVETSVLSPHRYWYPNIADAFGDMRRTMRAGLESELEALHLPSRTLRRRAKKQARKLDLSAAALEAAPQMAAEYGLPVDAIAGSIVALLRGVATPEEASRRLFMAIAEPVKFVETYFERISTDRSALPQWMRRFGSDFERRFIELRDKVQPLLEYESARREIEKMIADRADRLGETVLAMADDTVEFGGRRGLVTELTACGAIPAQVPATEVVGRVLSAYVRQIIGFAGNAAKIERSFGGDLVHALYLSHVDLWRGDRRFSAVVRQAVPQYAGRIVPTLKELPNSIDAWHLANAA